MLHEILARLPRAAAGSSLRLKAGASRCSLYNNHGPVGSSVVAILFGPGDRAPRLVVKLSRQTDTVTREEAALRHLSTVVPDRVPRLYLSGYVRGMAFMAMEAVEGEIISARHGAPSRNSEWESSVRALRNRSMA